VAVVDGHWATVGSSNLDPLSLLLAREANVMVDDVGFASELRHRLVQAMELQGLRVEPAHYAQRPWQQRMRDQLAYGLMRLGVFLTGKRY
jgi:cardiolipin synthase